jgi:hypothetical protein
LQVLRFVARRICWRRDDRRADSLRELRENQKEQDQRLATGAVVFDDLPPHLREG